MNILGTTKTIKTSKEIELEKYPNIAFDYDYFNECGIKEIGFDTLKWNNDNKNAELDISSIIKRIDPLYNIIKKIETNGSFSSIYRVERNGELYILKLVHLKYSVQQKISNARFIKKQCEEVYTIKLIRENYDDELIDTIFSQFCLGK